MRKYVSPSILAGLVLAVTAPPAVASGVCDNSATVGGGTLAVYSPSPGAGWDVGTGQCNGDFTVATDPSFPGGALELGMRIEQRSAGQLNSPEHAGINYQVQAGPDTTQPNNARAWWNFQHSIAYNGAIGDLDELTFVIRTDVGSFLPTSPAFDMLFLRTFIDDRRAPKNTTTFSDIYQTSQNPVFAPWFGPSPFNYNPLAYNDGAWMLTLYAVEAGKFQSVSVCAHTPFRVCAPAPVVYTCTGFEPPMDKDFIVKKKANRVLPLKMVCQDANGVVLGPNAISAPLVQITKSAPDGEETLPADTYLSAGQGTDGNEFVFDGTRWNFNLQTKNFTGTGTYAITAVGAGTNLLVGAPSATFTVK